MKHGSKNFFGLKSVLLTVLLVFAVSLPAMAANPPEVNVMPDGDTDSLAYTWAANSLNIWGNVVWGDSASGTYEWDIDNDGTPDYSGAVTNAKNIECTHAYGTAGMVEAKLTVTDGNGESDSAIVRIKVLPSVTKEARIQLAIEKGLKWLYLRQESSGRIKHYASYAYGAETSAAVLAFENRGHKPCTQDLNGDTVVNAADRAIWEKDNIYANTVHRGLDYAISTLARFAVAATYDSNTNGDCIADSSSSYRPYKIGMYMMALVGAGDVASGAPNLAATTGPAGVLGKTYRTIVEDMVDYCDYAQYDGYTTAYGVNGVIGGWRYSPNQHPDNSACQWPVIGMEAAEFGWGVSVRQIIKDHNYNWINYSQYFTGYESSSAYGACGYTGRGTGSARTASGICQLSFQGKVKTHPRILAAAQRMNLDRGHGNYYAMYALAKGARIAKIDTNFDGIGDAYSEIQTMNGWDWYETYSDYLLSTQGASGNWPNYYGYVFSTAWSVEILTKNVFTLRPIADLQATPNPTPANTPVTFDFSGSFHQDSAKVLVDWWLDINDDGTWDHSGSFPVTSVIYSGGYADTGADYSVTAKLRVSDNSTPTEYGEDLLVVNITSGNVAPVPDPGPPGGGTYNGVVGSPINFDGSGSYEPNAGPPLNDYIVSWDWDLDGDGAYDDASGETVSWTWSTAYSGDIGLKVTDSYGLSSTAAVYTQVFVVDLWPENYVKLSSRRINRYVYEYEYQFDMRNRGTGDATNVECTIDSIPPKVTASDDHVDFGTVIAGAVVTSSDSFKLCIDRRYPVTDMQIRWKLEYDDAGGSHVTFLDFPLM